MDVINNNNRSTHTAYDRVPSSAKWTAIATQIVIAITDAYADVYTQGSEHFNVINSDYSKLLLAAEKLEECVTKKLRNDISLQHDIWHDLRNIIAAIQGYIELIHEDHHEDNSLSQQLDAIYNLSQQLLSIDDESQLSNTLRSQATPRLKSINGTILIVDDQQQSREILKRQFTPDQHTVLEAASGKEMFVQLEQNSVDLILLDLILPEMDGHELLDRLKHNSQWRAIPVIVVSGNKDTDRVIRCIEAGAEDYLFKPFNPILLQARINAGVERKRWHDREQQYRQELEKKEQFIRKVFGRYVCDEIVDTLLENPDGLDMGGTQQKVTIMMADIRDFTPIAERLPPQQVVRLLNNYLGAMSEIIMAYNGSVNEFIGDAILAIFGVPENRPDDTDRALACALAMQNAMSIINEQNRSEGLPAIEIGISLNTGLVIAGNIGSTKRTKYGVVGHTVNQTARIEDVCPPGKILISESTLNDAKSILSIEASQSIQAKGILQAIKTFQLNAISSPEKNP